jgi:hypothetical protein
MDLEETIDKAWERARNIPGFIVENEARFLALVAACAPPDGVIVEIGSFKGKSTVLLASVVARYGGGPVVAIDPHAGLSYLGTPGFHDSPTFDEFLTSVKASGVEPFVEVRRASSREVAKGWNRPIRLLWIDGDHCYRACKEDFDLFSPFLSDGGIIAFHDSLNLCEGPIRVFVEEVLRSNRFGAAGFVHSIAWSQFRPADGSAFRALRAHLDRRASPLVPFVAEDATPKGLRRLAYRLHRARVPRHPLSPAAWAASLTIPGR